MGSRFFGDTRTPYYEPKKTTDRRNSKQGGVRGTVEGKALEEGGGEGKNLTRGETCPIGRDKCSKRERWRTEPEVQGWSTKREPET